MWQLVVGVISMDVRELLHLKNTAWLTVHSCANIDSVQLIQGIHVKQALKVMVHESDALLQVSGTC
jgi:hypothetical protein